MANNKPKLELTWIGKDKRPRLEPRILIEDPGKSHHAKHRVSENDQFDNMLIHGDNLLALRALQSSFEGRVKCVYIDPPFNTGEAFEHYDDGLEHSIWLGLMDQRIRIIHKLLSQDGTLFVHIDDNELAYLVVLCDEIFGRKNRVNIITFKQSSASGPKAINPGLVTTCNYLVFYAKDKSKWKPNRIYQAVPRDARYNNFIEKYELPCENWEITTLRNAFCRIRNLEWNEAKQKYADKLEEEMTKFVTEYRDRVIQPASIKDKDVNEEARGVLEKSRINPGVVLKCAREGMDDYYFMNGKQLLFYRNKIRKVNGVETSSLAASNLWDDLLSNNVHKEGGVYLPNGKKPEALLQRVFEFVTEPGDIVLDSFLGSGTTAAAAHKMNRRWIGVELGEQCDTHCLPRLTRLIDGEDPDGITKVLGWKGGGGFRYYHLAPSLIKTDQWGNSVINPEFNPELLAEAVCKVEGFEYAPSQEHYWQHGKASEQDFIYVTTQTLTRPQLEELSNAVGADRSLLVCCAAFRVKEDTFPNLTLKKIPKAVLHRCEWDHDDYSLRISNLPAAPPKMDDQGQIELL